MAYARISLRGAALSEAALSRLGRVAGDKRLREVLYEGSRLIRHEAYRRYVAGYGGKSGRGYRVPSSRMSLSLRSRTSSRGGRGYRAYAGFELEPWGGRHIPSWLNSGTQERYRRDGRRTGRVRGNRFWSGAVRASRAAAEQLIYDGAVAVLQALYEGR